MKWWILPFKKVWTPPVAGSTILSTMTWRIWNGFCWNRVIWTERYVYWAAPKIDDTKRPFLESQESQEDKTIFSSRGHLHEHWSDGSSTWAAGTASQVQAAILFGRIHLHRHYWENRTRSYWIFQYSTFGAGYDFRHLGVCNRLNWRFLCWVPLHCWASTPLRLGYEFCLIFPFRL